MGDIIPGIAVALIRGKRILTTVTERPRTCRFVIVAAGVCLFAGPGLAKSFDIEAYCQKVASLAGGGHAIESACQERKAKARIEGRTIEPRIVAYCEKIASTMGGSYSIMDACVDQEESAGTRLKK